MEVNPVLHFVFKDDADCIQKKIIADILMHMEKFIIKTVYKLELTSLNFCRNIALK